MEGNISASFLEILGAGLLCVSVLAGICSLIPGLRAHSLKLMAIVCVASLAIFANALTTYFAAIFVIATAVTELEFLQNLAAIIRGNKDFFDYQREALPKESKLKDIETTLESDTLMETEVGDDAPLDLKPTAKKKFR